MLQREQILIKQSKKGDVESFEELIREYQQFAYNIALKMLGNTEDAKDASQDALIKVYKNIGKYREDSKFSTWLYRIVVNVCKDFLRKSKNVKFVNDEYQTLNIPETDLDADPVSSYERSEVVRQVNVALDEVPEPFRTALILFDIQGMSYNEISDIEGVALGTVRSRIYRAREYMRAILQNNLKGGSYEL